MKLDPHLIRRLAVESFRAERTVRRWLAGEAVQPVAAASLEAAAARLGVPLPTPQGPQAA
jgi:hypothetical protein